MGDGYDPSRKAKVVGAIQWAAVGYSASSAVAQAVTNYYFFVQDAFGLPEPLGIVLWVSFVASTLGGLVGGYLWVKRHTDSAEQEHREHRKRVAFLFVLLALGIAVLLAKTVISNLFGTRFDTVPHFLVPSVLDLLALAGAYGLVYRTDVDWIDAGGRTTDGRYRPSRLVRVVGGVQWAVTALYLGLVTFGVVSEYLLRTRDSFSLDPAQELITGVVVAFVGGYFWARRPANSEEDVRTAHRRRVEYVLSVFAFGFALGLLGIVALSVLPSLGYELTVVWLVGVIGLSLLLAYVSAYLTELDLLDRLLST